MPTPPPPSRARILTEIALIFAVFCIQGAWPVPDVNEPYYLGKAIHYWNPDWLRGDFFMESADSHKVFYFTFGWLSLWLSPTALAWTGRISTWLLLAWAWRRLSFAVLPRPWWSVLTGALFACLMERCHMAGEWVIGGVEAKGFAYALVFLGIEAIVRNRWNRALWLLGAAAAFHVLVGGWSVVAAAVAWLWLKKPRPLVAPTDGATNGRGFVSLWPGILGGLLLALPGLLPVLGLDWSVDRNTVQEAHEIYVFQRLPHHLVLAGIRGKLILRFVLLTAFWLGLGWLWPGSDASRRLRAFVMGAVAIAALGAAIQMLVYLDLDRPLAADLLRYYWFRLSDVAVPLGVALEAAALAAWAIAERPALGRGLLAVGLLVAAAHLSDRAIDRIAPLPPRSYSALGRAATAPSRAKWLADFDHWREACEWVANSGNIPPGARFLTPRLAQTFKWFAHRANVADWKDVPQDAGAIVQWWRRIADIYSTGQRSPLPRWHEWLTDLDPQRLRQLANDYDADYLITQRTDPPLQLDKVYENPAYIIYRLR